MKTINPPYRMLLYKNKQIIYKVGNDNVIIANNILPARFEAFEKHLKKKYGKIPDLSRVKMEFLHF